MTLCFYKIADNALYVKKAYLFVKVFVHVIAVLFFGGFLFVFFIEESHYFPSRASRPALYCRDQI